MRIIKDGIDNGWGNLTGRIWVAECTCSVCGEKKDCLQMDGSDDEYGNGAICKQCIDVAFVEQEYFMAGQNSERDEYIYKLQAEIVRLRAIAPSLMKNLGAHPDSVDIGWNCALEEVIAQIGESK